MILFLDTEFTGLRQSAQLISLALVSMDGQWFYAEFTDYDPENLSDWHKKYILSNLLLEKDIQPDFAEGAGRSIRANTQDIVRSLQEWLIAFEKVEIWADVLGYDWVFFCELFGGSLHLPKQIFYIPHDFSTLLKVKGIDPDVPRESLAKDWATTYSSFKHNALYDAFLLRIAYQQFF